MFLKNKQFKDSLKKTIMVFAALLCFSTGITFSYAAHKGNGALDDAAHETYLIDSIRNNYIAAMMIMAEQLTTVMVHQVFVIGTFFDAKHQLELQRYFEESLADAHIQYHPSHQMCSFATNIRSLAASERQSYANASILNEGMVNRQLLGVDTLASGGPVSDKKARMRKFKETYCNPSANKGVTEFLCGMDHDGDAVIDTPGSTTAERIDKDIDFMRTLGRQYTVDVNLTDGTLTPDEEDIIALSRNLYAHDVFTPLPEGVLMSEEGKDTYQDTRSVTAMRSVAQHSFSSLVGMKARGSADSTTLVSDYMSNIMLDLGIQNNELEEFLGDNPSYFAQMEVLTNKMFQHPTFFVNLYQKPDNVKRTTVALQALEIMQDRDRFEAALRREMLISMILETQLRSKQEAAENKILRTFGAFVTE